MAVLIPALGACVPRMTSGERRLAERLEQKLDDDYLLWYDVPVGPKQRYPDFVIVHPRRGLLILETKDWRLETIRKATKQYWEILDGSTGLVKPVINPLEQARHCAIEVRNALERDSQLVHHDGPHKNKLAFPWGHGVVFTSITRKQFTESGLDQTLEPHYAICKDEMLESVEPEAFQQRLWQMFPHAFGKMISLPQLERVRWIMFPQVRIPEQGSLFTDEVPDIVRVMDLQQEQLARSLGEGHRVIHGVAGSGKTMILGYRAEHLAKLPSAKPILVLCFNRPLAQKLEAVFAAKGIAERVHVRNFHKWCHEQLEYSGQAIPQGSGDAYYQQLVDDVIRGVERNQIPSGQYQAVLIDEGHDFRPEWFKLVVQMVDPQTNSLLVLYDCAQNIYQKRRAKGFSFKSVGIQAAGRTTILRINYRNTRQILEAANRVAAEFLKPDAQDEDGVPLVQPVSCGRDGQAALVVRLPNLRDEAARIAEWLTVAHHEGHAWGDMAVLCRDKNGVESCGRALSSRGVPNQVRRRGNDFKPLENSVKVMTMHASKGLEFPVVALAGVGRMPLPKLEPEDEALLFYVAATRATHRLMVPVAGSGAFGAALEGVEVQP